MGLRSLKFLQTINIAPLVPLMVVQSLLSPAGQRKVLVVVLSLPAHVEAQLPPCHQFIEKSFCGFTHVPPPASAAGCFLGKMIRSPLLFGRQLVKDLVNREVAEMEIGGKPARTVIVRMIPRFLIG